MFASSRRPDDADVIRARLRVLLDEGSRGPGWSLDAAVDPSLVTVLPPLVRAPAPASDDEPVTVPVDDAGAPPARHGRDPAGWPDGLGRHRAPGAATRVDPGRRSAWALWVVAVLAAAAVAGWSWAQRPDVEPVGQELAPATSVVPSPAAGTTPAAATLPTTVVVSVVGLVRTPGLVTLPAGARVADAVAAAGGFLPEADPASVNAAAVVTDGQQIAVGVPGAGVPPPSAGGGSAGGLLDLNSATAGDLDALPGIGPVLAERIVAHRDSQGPFTSVEQLDDVPGIGPTTYAELAGLVTV